MQKTFVYDEGLPKKITGLEFDTFSPEEVRQLSHVQVAHMEMYRPDVNRKEYTHGPLDLRLGGTKREACWTCGEKESCVGHFGFIDFCVPIFHLGFFERTLFTLQMICKTCSRVLLGPTERNFFLQKMRSFHSYQEKYALLKGDMARKCKKPSQICSFCKAVNGTVKKVNNGLKLIHEVSKDGPSEEKLIEFENVVEHNSEIADHLKKVREDLDPGKVLRLFEAIPLEDRELLDTPDPENFILTNFLVPPRCIRPSVFLPGGESNEDDLSAKLADIVRMNTVCKEALEQSKALTQIKSDWEYIQFHAATYINCDSTLIKDPKSEPVKKFRALIQRLKGKQGRFRANLSGKRVDFSSRSVISPDPNLRIDQLGVPRLVAMEMTYPERCTALNHEKLQRLIIRGNEHPGAKYIIKANGERRYLVILPKVVRERYAEELAIGDIVERHMEDGDIVLFNRQPSLHKLSIMSHRAKVMPWRTFRFNECVCTPYNADFDGDEMNLHLPQTEEARAEAIHLMGSTRNLVTPRSGEPLIAAIQDFITAAFLISRKDVFFTRDMFGQYCNYMFDAEVHIDLPVPAIMKPVELYTGKQLFSILFRPNEDCKVLINHRGGGKNYDAKANLEEMDPRDTFVVIRNSELLCGLMDKAVLGSGNKKSIFHLLLRDFGADVAAARMSGLAKLCSRFLSDRGFSIGIDDVQPPDILNEHKEKVTNEHFERCEGFLRAWKSGKLEAEPGSTVEATLERKMNAELSEIREISGKLCSRYLHPTNSPLTMAFCGSKGSSINISQMIACVGQQTVGGSRVTEGFINRTLPHFEFHSKSPEAKGFVKNSFYSGMTATEFFFHTMGGREGLVDTAVKTADTGYLARKLMKAFEDLSVQYDHTVRNATGVVIQFEYGADSLDPANMETDNKPMDFDRVLAQAMAICPSTMNILSPNEFKALIERKLVLPNLSHCSANFMKTLREFLEEKVVFLEEQDEMLRHWNPEKPLSEELSHHLKVKEFSMTEAILDKFLQLCGLKYHKAIIEPGTAVGALAAQSISEPSTQMTLKTFHFAGVASMNITEGVPRIREIIHATENISTPIVKAPLTIQHNLEFAYLIKGQVERTSLGNIAYSITKVFDNSNCFVEVKVSLAAIRELQLRDVSISTIRECVQADKKVPTSDVTTQGDDTLIVYPDLSKMKANLFFGLEILRNSLPQVVVKGISAVNRVMIAEHEKKGESAQEKEKYYNLVAETQDLLAVMNVDGIIGVETTSNHLQEVKRVLGIEAARKTIIDEMSSTMTSHKIAVDIRHLMLLADIMTFKGTPLGVNRDGVAKMKDSVLMLASFEKTTDHLFNAAEYNRKDNIEGVSESIIVGAPVPLGTSAFKIIKRANIILPEPPGLLLDSPQFNLPFLSTPLDAAMQTS